MSAKPDQRQAGRRHELVLIILLALLLGFAGWRDPAFLRAATQLELASHAWELAILALPMTLIIISGGIDLAVGSTMALCAVVFGLAFEAGVNIWVGCTLALLTGAAAGAINGAFVAGLRVHPLIVTLATLSAYRGIAEGVSRARPISGFPEQFAAISGNATFRLPLPAALLILLAVIAGTLLTWTTLGRRLYAIGFNETASRYSGVDVGRIKMLLYTSSGLAAAVAALLFVARRNTAKADIAAGLELEVITAVVLGGASIEGGRGTVTGTLLGVLLIHETREFISWHWNSDELILIVTGFLLLASVVLSRRGAA